MEQVPQAERLPEMNHTKTLNKFTNSSAETSPNGRRYDPKAQQYLEKQIIHRKCLDHPAYPCDQLNLDEHAKPHRMCISCIEQKNITKDKVLSINSLLNYPQQYSHISQPSSSLEGRMYLFHQLPILKEQGLIAKLQAIFGTIDIISSQIDAYFIELSKQIEISILKAQNLAKSKLNDVSKYYSNLLRSYEETACVKKYQEAVVAASSDEEKKLHELILESYKQAETNAARIQGDLDVFMKQKERFSLQQPKAMRLNICGMIQSVDFFRQQADNLNKKEQIHSGNPQVSIISFQDDDDDDDEDGGGGNEGEDEEENVSNRKNCQKSPHTQTMESKQQLQKQQESQQGTPQRLHQDADGNSEQKQQQLNDMLISFSQASLIQQSAITQSQQNQHLTTTIPPPPQCPSSRISLPFLIPIIPSKIYKKSFKKIKIESEYNHSYLLTHIGKELNSQCFMDFTLTKSDKYVIQVEIIHNNAQQKNSGFIFGLIEDANKHSRDVSDSAMCYIECQDGGGIDKMIKGTRLHSSSDSKSRRKFEFRVHLAEKYLRIASYPDYSTIAELDDPSKIKDDEEYYFAVSICFPEDQVRVLDVFSVDKFDEKMG